MNSKFVAYVLKEQSAQLRMAKAIKGVAVRGINIGDVRALQIPFPSREEQDEIVKRVEALFSIAFQMEEKLKRAQDRVDKLTASILAKAFRGELVPQEPNDEPAEKLLEVIQLEK